MEIDLERRRALKAGGGVGLFLALGSVGLLQSNTAQAEWSKPAFGSKGLDEALSAMGVTAPQDGAGVITLTVPEVAENGAVVPVTVETSLANVEQISILVEKNPSILAARFTLPAGTEGMVMTRVKMGQTSNVMALVKADGKFYRIFREVKVTTGGCAV